MQQALQSEKETDLNNRKRIVFMLNDKLLIVDDEKEIVLLHGGTISADSKNGLTTKTAGKEIL